MGAVWWGQFTKPYTEFSWGPSSQILVGGGDICDSCRCGSYLPNILLVLKVQDRLYKYEGTISPQMLNFCQNGAWSRFSEAFNNKCCKRKVKWRNKSELHWWWLLLHRKEEWHKRGLGCTEGKGQHHGDRNIFVYLQLCGWKSQLPDSPPQDSGRCATVHVKIPSRMEWDSNCEVTSLSRYFFA